MTLSDIKFTYEDKINNLNNRMEKYEDIIKSYNKKIRRAEKEENPNVSSLIKARGQYEHKIENMGVVKEYYQEFVDTADYLLQNLNSNDVVLANMQYEHLERKNVKLHKEIEELENRISIYEINNEKMKQKYEKKIGRLEISVESRDDIIKRKKAQIKNLRKDSIKKDSVSYKKMEKELIKLYDENTYLKNVNEVLRKKNKRLVDYCNHLLNRRSDEPVGDSVSDNNIFKQLMEKNAPPLVFYGVNDEF